MGREYKGELFRKFALTMKKKKLWNKFRILEYYFRFYSLTTNSLVMIYEYLTDEKSMMPKEWFDAYGEFRDYCGTPFTNTDKDIKLSEFFKYYKV
jgi:hypothetical protein